MPDQVFTVTIKAVNRGFRPVTIVGAGFKLEGGKIADPFGATYHPWPLPKTLDDSESVEIHFDYDPIKQAVEDGYIFRLAYVRDAEGKKYTTKPPPALLEPKKKRIAP